MKYSGSGLALSQPKAAILNSRQPKRPIGTDSWIIATIEAVKYCAQNGFTILTSIGMNTYEIVLYAGSRFVCPMIVVIAPSSPRASDIRHIVKDHHLNEESVGFYMADELETLKKIEWPARDKIIITLSDMIIPISIREGGNLSSLIEDYPADKVVMEEFLIPYNSNQRTLKQDYSRLKIAGWAQDKQWDFLIHWTKSSNGPWPGETTYDYYDAVVNSESYARSGKETLCRILKEKKLRASNKHLHKGIMAVAFSGLMPADAVPLMKWRARYMNMSFEPYGIAIHNSISGELGIQKVLYGSPDIYETLQDEDKTYFHSLGKIGDWMPEKEFRFIGDFELGKIPTDKIRVIVKNSSEVPEVQRYTESQVLALFE